MTIVTNNSLEAVVTCNGNGSRYNKEGSSPVGRRKKEWRVKSISESIQDCSADFVNLSPSVTTHRRTCFGIYASTSIIKLEHCQIFINSWHNLHDSNCVRNKNHQSADDVYEAQESRNLLHFLNAAIHVSSTVTTLNEKWLPFLRRLH